MGRVDLDWIKLEGDIRIKTVCVDGIHAYLPTNYLIEVTRDSKSPKTPNTYAFHLKIFYKWLYKNDIDLVNITYQDIKRYKNEIFSIECSLFDKKDISHTTKEGCFAGVKRFLEWCCQEHRKISAEEISKIKKIKYYRKTESLPQGLLMKDIKIIRKWINHRWDNDKEILVRNRLIIELLFEGAFRRGELLGIKLNDIDLDMGFIKISVDDEKYKESWKLGETTEAQKTDERVVVVGDNAIEWINKYIMLYRPKEAIKKGHGKLLCVHYPKSRRGQIFTKYSLDYLFSLINDDVCGLSKKVSPHTFRHTFASMALEDGLDQRIIQAQLGHIDPNTTAKYVQVSPYFRKKHLDNWRKNHPERYDNE